MRCLYKEKFTGSREEVVSVETDYRHPVGQPITGPFSEDLTELAEILCHDLTPAILPDGTSIPGGTVYLRSLKLHRKP